MSITFQFQGVKKPESFQAPTLRSWLKDLAKTQGRKLTELNYLFVSDEALLQVNLEYLQHNTYTDIITFNNADAGEAIEGDIFISLERVNDNALKFGAKPEEELVRVMAHGLLHLCGFNDKKPKEKLAMRSAEESAIRSYRAQKRKRKPA